MSRRRLSIAIVVGVVCGACQPGGSPPARSAPAAAPPQPAAAVAPQRNAAAPPRRAAPAAPASPGAPAAASHASAHRPAASAADPRPARAGASARPREATGRAPLPGISVEVHRGFIRVYQRPVLGSPWRGFIAKAGRYPVLGRRPRGGGCTEPWYQLGPEAWACSGWLLPRAKPPTVLARMESTWRPGPFLGTRATGRRRVPFFPSLRDASRGRARWLRGDVGVAVRSRLLLMRETFLVTHTGGLVAERHLQLYPASSLVGVSLARPQQLPLAFALRETPLLRRRGGSLARGPAPLGRYAVRAVKRGPTGAPVTLTQQGVLYLALATGELVRREDVALAARPPAPPAGVGPKERWAHVDASERLVYAMEGARARRVMLASLGANTPAGVFRVEQKIVYKDMQQRFGEDPFYLEAVPYVVFFRGDFAFHGAYWHDGFGTRRSHGCLNLSLSDARYLFDWLGPALPPGFFAIYPTGRDPGAVVRVAGRYQVRSWEPPLRRRSRPRGAPLATPARRR